MGRSKNVGRGDDLTDTILNTLRGSDNGRSMKVKSLRKLVLLSIQCDDDNDKEAKKRFKKKVQKLEADGRVTLSEEGVITLTKSERSKSKKQKKKDKKKRKKTDVDEKSDAIEEADHDYDAKKKRRKGSEVDGADKDAEGAGSQVDGMPGDEGDEDAKNKPCKGNPQGVTRLFLGNLPFAVDETSLSTFLADAVTHIKWITDKETGKFYGSAFVEMRTSKDAARAVNDINGKDLMNRPIKVNYAPARDGDVWPPKSSVVTGGKGGGGGQAGGEGVKAMSAKPEGCTKLFVGNLSYDIDDDAITKFFATVDAELKAVRWLHHKDSGDFKGCGFVEFWNTESCAKGATLNGKSLLGRPMRIDWTD